MVGTHVLGDTRVKLRGIIGVSQAHNKAFGRLPRVMPRGLLGTRCHPLLQLSHGLEGAFKEHGHRRHTQRLANKQTKKKRNKMKEEKLEKKKNRKKAKERKKDAELIRMEK